MTTSLRSRRYLSYAGSVIVALSSGTGYAFSLIASPLAERLGLSATSINFVGAAGNWGMYLLGPLSGFIVDRAGPKLPLLVATVCMFCGFFGLNRAYINPNRDTPTLLLSFYMWLTGLGSCAGFNAALNAAAKNFPATRGTATAFPIAALGLCAFMYGTIAKVAVPGNTAAYLLILASMTSVSEFIGFLVIQILPTQTPKRTWKTRLTYRNKNTDHDSDGGEHSECDSSYEHNPVIERDPTSSEPTPGSHSTSASEPTLETAVMWKPDFWLVAFVMSMLSGCGLMYINNVGHCVEALFKDRADPYEHSTALSKIQAIHVSIISLSSCMGRITAGVSSDYILHRYSLPRTWCLVCASIVSIFAQVSGWIIDSMDSLYIVSSLSGFAYGLLFGCAPVIISELFGIETFSQNWGWISLTPAFSSTFFNVIYGRIYDSHSTIVARRCMDGQDCYASAFLFTSVAAMGAVAFSVVLHMRQTRHNEISQYLD